jgi:hypothetical protein
VIWTCRAAAACPQRPHLHSTCTRLMAICSGRKDETRLHTRTLYAPKAANGAGMVDSRTPATSTAVMRLLICSMRPSGDKVTRPLQCLRCDTRLMDVYHLLAAGHARTRSYGDGKRMRRVTFWLCARGAVYRDGARKTSCILRSSAGPDEGPSPVCRNATACVFLLALSTAYAMCTTYY